MPFYQAAYFLNTRGQENLNEVILKDKMKDKAYLRSLSQVGVINHTEFFGRNLRLAACKLSPEFKEKYKNDADYQKEVDKLCENLREDYIKDKNLDD